MCVLLPSCLDFQELLITQAINTQSLKSFHQDYRYHQVVSFHILNRGTKHSRSALAPLGLD